MWQMETGSRRAVTEQRLTAAEGLPALEALPAWLARLRRWCSLLLVLAAGCIVLSAWLAQDIGLLAYPAALWLSSSAAFMALLAIALGCLVDRVLVQWLRSLMSSTQAERRRAEALRAWQLEMSSSLQQASHPADLAQRLLSGLARCLPLQQGLCCYWDEQEQVLCAAARYGGEGTDANAVLQQPLLAPLLLQAAHSRREIVIEQPGADYLRISSGLGDAEPAQLLVLPLEHQGRLLGVLELASLQPMADAARGRLSDVMPVFALCLGILKPDCFGAIQPQPAAAAGSGEVLP
jgi:hypothetical protein